MLQLPISIDRNPAGVARFNGSLIRKLTGIEPASVSVTHWFQPDRDRIADFIESIYSSAYGAVIERHYPSFISVHGTDGNVLAAAGFRSAAYGPLFLEQYLPAPIERLAQSAAQSPVRRERIAEVGNLAATGSGGSLFLFAMLADFLRRAAFTHAAVTATESLQRTFKRFHFEFQVLAFAQPARLPDGGASWGRYFECNPCVLFGSVASAYARLRILSSAGHDAAPQSLTFMNAHLS